MEWAGIRRNKLGWVLQLAVTGSAKVSSALELAILNLAGLAAKTDSAGLGLVDRTARVQYCRNPPTPPPQEPMRSCGPVAPVAPEAPEAPGAPGALEAHGVSEAPEDPRALGHSGAPAPMASGTL